MPPIQPALQLYTVRDLTKADFAAAMREVARIGYRAVQLAGYGNLTSAAEVKKAVDAAGLSIISDHANFGRLEKELDRVLDDQAIYGNRNLICSSIGEARRKDAAGWKEAAASLNKIGAVCRQRGLEFAYHNHSFEFQTFDGVTGFEILWQNSDPALVKSELDVYWVQHGGADPVAYMRKLGKRLLNLHLKDMAAGPERRFAPVGTGLLDFPAILKTGREMGVTQYIVEQDQSYQTPPLEAARTSLENLRQFGLA